VVLGFSDKFKVLTWALLVIGAMPAGGATRPYVANASQCRACHEKQYQFWANTKHASAYLVLFSKGSHLDWECMGCHSVGFGQPEGFSRIAHPVILDNPANDPKDKPFIETFMAQVFGDEAKKGPLDSRLQPARYEKLRVSYRNAVEKLEKEGEIKKLYVGVQCENCHGNRDGHPGAPIAGLPKKVKETTCRTCHAPPNAPNFSAGMIPLVSCPLISSKQ
jgi:hypothetical protein